MVELAARLATGGKRVLIVAHRQELIMQIYQTLARRFDVPIDVEMAEYKAGHGGLFESAPIVLASAQTLLARTRDGKRRMSKFDPFEFSAVIFDEAHHYAAATFASIWHYFNVGGVRAIGLTATPDRRDKRTLGAIFNTIAYTYQIYEAINDGWLVPVNAYLAPVESLDLSWIKTRAGDFVPDELAKEMEKEKNVLAVVQPALELAAGLRPSALSDMPPEHWREVLAPRMTQSPHRVIVFCASVQHAKLLADMINQMYGPIATGVWGGMSDSARAEARARLNRGDVRIITNCNLWTEGVDEPCLDVVVMARPTKSRALYSQMAGRVMRPLPGLVDNLPDAEARRGAISASAKPACTIVDFVGNTGRHKLVYAPHLLEGCVRSEVVDQMVALARRRRRPTGLSELVSAAEQRITKAQVEAEARARAAAVARVRYALIKADPFDLLGVNRSVPLIIKRQDDGPTEKQRAFLMRFGIRTDGLTRRDARRLIVALLQRLRLDRATPRQVEFLKRYGIDARGLHKAAASALIDEIKRNNWRKPPSHVIDGLINAGSEPNLGLAPHLQIGH